MKREKSSPTFLTNNLWSCTSIVIYLPQRMWERRWLLAKCGIWSEPIHTTPASFPFLFWCAMVHLIIWCSAKECKSRHACSVIWHGSWDLQFHEVHNFETDQSIIRNNPWHLHKGLDLNVTPTHTMFIKWAQWSGTLITLPTVQPTLRQLHAHCTPLRP